MPAADNWSRSLLSRSVIDSTDSYLKYLAQWTAISIISLLPPILVWIGCGTNRLALRVWLMS